MAFLGPTPEYLRKANRVKAVIALCIAVVIALCVVLAGLAAQYAKAKEMTLVSSSAVPAQTADVEKKKNENPIQSVFAPDLVALLGQEADEVVSSLGHGAKVSDSLTLPGVAGASYTYMTVPLANEPADKLAGTPTVYLLADDQGKVVEAGYQAGMWYLGYGSLSFTDAVDNAHVVEKLLAEAGLPIPEGQVKAPEDKAIYGEYGSDGVTLVGESYEFVGTESKAGKDYEWRSSVDYDYSYANETGNLANTIRVVSVFVSAA